ncbi:MAG: metallopeptidase family protein [Candidatus Paceibacterota bacterium]|jgi:predicted Zn-dependent protease with MMP-like domain
MTHEEFEALVGEIGFSSVPERFRVELSNVALTVEDEPDSSVRAEFDLGDEDTLLGLYQGIPHTERGVDYAALPDKIIIYRLPTLEAAEEDRLPVRKIIEDTIWHEVAHHFGLSEHDVERRERERGVL